MHRTSARARLGTAAVLAVAALGAMPATGSAHITSYCGHAQSIKAFWWTFYVSGQNVTIGSLGDVTTYRHYHYTDHWYSSLGQFGLHKYKHSQVGNCGVKQRIGTLVGQPDPSPSGPELGDVQPVWVDVGEPDTTASAASAPRIDVAQPAQALDTLDAAGYDTAVFEVTPATNPDGQRTYVYADIPPGSPPPAGDCVVSVLTRDFEAVDPAAPPHELSMEVADRATADALGHGC
jgi:hypothetical protein